MRDRLRVGAQCRGLRGLSTTVDVGRAAGRPPPSWPVQCQHELPTAAISRERSSRHSP